MSLDKSLSLRRLSRQLLGSFFQDLANVDPWWVSIVSAVDGDQNTTLTHLLGFEHQVGLEFLCSAGLLKSGPKNNTFSVLYKEWDLFIVQES